MNSTSEIIAQSKRAYKQGARADAAARTAEAIVAAFRAFLNDEWYNDISLERVAKAANVTVPTVLRHFGSKEGVLEAVCLGFQGEVMEMRRVTPGDIDATISGVLTDYEITGDMVMRFLNQEDRIAAMKAVTDIGKAHHRLWVRESFAPYLEGLDAEQAAWRLDGLVVALDIYVWKLLRRDRGRSVDEVKRFMRQLVDAIIGSS
jgi:AcrR family transcriptional regulator